MSQRTLACDQAIFTSIRAPTGEGYRIIAASRHLRPDEKQKITRSSPSHDALCEPAADADRISAPIEGAAFYPLPGGRLCVALSCYAGAEHTGRGGQRVYTYNLVFSKQDFLLCAYNPFVVLRAMVEAQLAAPQLKPSPVLPELQLCISETATNVEVATLNGLLHPSWRVFVLDALLNERSLILNLKRGWLEAAEALLLGVPGPMRSSISLSIGLRFSVGRCHRLNVLYDDHGVIKSRVTGRTVEFVDPDATPEPDAPASAWLSFVHRHWAGDDLSTLAQRTSRGFADTSELGRNRVGRCYNDTDAIPETDTAELIRVVTDCIAGQEIAEEKDLVEELLRRAQRALLERFDRTSWTKASPHWPAICNLWQQAGEGHRFAVPLAQRILRSVAATHPPTAAEAALELARNLPPAEDGEDSALVLNAVLARLAEWAGQAAQSELETLPKLCKQWRAIRPKCPIVTRIYDRCTTLAGK